MNIKFLQDLLRFKTLLFLNGGEVIIDFKINGGIYGSKPCSKILNIKEQSKESLQYFLTIENKKITKKSIIIKKDIDLILDYSLRL